jgi:tetratricopeptide (TPR) repeat protein
VARTPDGDAPTREWLQTVLDQAESDPVRKRARQALRAGDWPALAQLAKEAGPQPPVLLQGFLSQLPDFAAHEKSDLIDKMRQAYPGEFRAPNRFARALNYDILAWLLATTDDPDWRLERRALELSKEAVQLAPNDGDFWNTLGMAYYRVGNWKEALAALETAMALSGGGDGLDWLILAMVQWHLGNKEEARRRYDQAIPWLEENGTDRTFRRLQAEAAELLGVKEKND